VPYSAAGNLIGVAYFPALLNIQDFVENAGLRKDVKKIALQNNCDSVMILIGSASLQNSFKTLVFEPNGAGPDGSFSTMCGNGIRAVAEYAREHLRTDDWPLPIGTRSGILEVESISPGSYRVKMGRIWSSRAALRDYINPDYFPGKENLLDVNLPPELKKEADELPFNELGTRCSIGFSSTEDGLERADGEPHLVLELDGAYVWSLAELKEITASCGAAICTNKKIFPQGINVNLVAPNPAKPNEFMICTFERNLGDDFQKAITQACGTGSTFAGAERLRKTGRKRAVAECLGGQLIIEERGGDAYLSGGVVRV